MKSIRQLTDEKAPSEIKNEVNKILNHIASNGLKVFSELEKTVTNKNVRRQTKLAAFWLLSHIEGGTLANF